MTLRTDDLKRVMIRYHERLISYRDSINELNVYPVPDGDTGTNMTLTLGSVLEAIEDTTSMDELVRAIAHGSLMGARGNSGVILSQILRGLSEAFDGLDSIGASHLVEALNRASAAAYAAVQQPVEGTILTVLRDAAEAASDAGVRQDTDLAPMFESVYRRAVESLKKTPDLLPVLSRAGVVDAGGAGFLLLLSSFLEVVTGAEVQLPDELLRARRRDLEVLSEIASLKYEVMFFLEAPDVSELRKTWDEIGDSIVVVGGDGIWNCHIHTDFIGPAIEAGISAGRPYDIRVSDLTESGHSEPSRTSPFLPRPEAVTASVGVIAVVAGEGLAEVFGELGAQGVIMGGQSANPSTEDLLRAVELVPADKVVLLPNNKNIIGVAEQIDALTAKHVEVVPTRNLPQGIAAMFGYSFMGDDLAQTAEDMAAAASSILTGEITRAVRDANVDFGPISRGDWMGIADGTIVIADADLEIALRGLVASILPPMAELVTIYTGESASPAATKGLIAWLHELHPEIEVKEVEGGQPLYPYLVSVE